MKKRSLLIIPILIPLLSLFTIFILFPISGQAAQSTQEIPAAQSDARFTHKKIPSFPDHRIPESVIDTAIAQKTISKAEYSIPAPIYAPDAPTIFDIWYGDIQSFGDPGIAQIWANVLGNVSDADGITSLTFTLNGGAAQPLSIGEDTRRLADPGDFNVEIATTDLISGTNEIAITAEDTQSITSTYTVTVNYVAGNSWPIPHSIDWSTVTNLQDVIQIIDGKWELVPGGLRTTQIDYDRVIALGGIEWENYEVLVPITIHEFEPTVPWPSVSAGFGLTFHWQGHTDDPVICSQPHCGWQPSGAGGWYDIGLDGPLSLGYKQDPSVTINKGDTFYWKMRVETITGVGPLYSLKVWRNDQIEPAEWNITLQRGSTDVPTGSPILIAHHVDLTVGDVLISPITRSLTVNTVGNGAVAAAPDKVAYELGEQVTLTATADLDWYFSGWSGDLLGTDNPTSLTMDSDKVITATFTQVTTKTLTINTIGNGEVSVVPEKSFYDFGEVVTLTATPDPDWVFSSWSGDLDSTSNPVAVIMNSDKVIIANFEYGHSVVTSDDFNICRLNDTLWTFIDPDGDTNLQMNGFQAMISLPAGTTHDTWGNNSTNFASNVPRIRQFVSDGDFELEIKFDNALSLGYQMEGVLIEQDDNDLLRFEFLHDGSNLSIFAASFTDGEADTKYYTPITNSSPIYMRIRRQGVLWTQSYSNDDVNWNDMASFSHPITVNSVSPYAGNGEIANTVLIDYVFETLTPIIPEDGNSPTTSLTVTTTGNGSVDVAPNQASYCGEEVELTASADPGWSFTGWNGDIITMDNPTVVIMGVDKTINARFSNGESVEVFLPLILNPILND